MKVSKIWYMNLDDLYQICVDRRKDVNNRNKMFGRNIGNLFNHISITIALEEVTSYEYIFIKIMGYKVSKFNDEKHILENRDVIEGFYPELNQNTLSSYFSLMEQLKSSNDFQYDYSYFMSPSGFNIGSCTVKITGDLLTTITSLEPINFFLNATCGECKINKDDSGLDYELDEKFKEKVNTDKRIQSYIIKNFYESLYKGMMNRLQNIDLVSDSFNYYRYLMKTPEDSIHLFSISNSDFSINFMDDPKSFILDTIKSYSVNHEQVDMDTELEFIVSGSFKTFFNFLNILPINLITSAESMTFPLEYSKNNIVEPQTKEFSGYNKRWYGRINTLINDANEKYKDEAKFIKQIEMTMNYSKMRFSVSLTFNDINIYYLNNIYKEYLTENDYSDKETYDFISRIIGLSKSIYNKMSRK